MKDVSAPRVSEGGPAETIVGRTNVSQGEERQPSIGGRARVGADTPTSEGRIHIPGEVRGPAPTPNVEEGVRTEAAVALPQLKPPPSSTLKFKWDPDVGVRGGVVVDWKYPHPRKGVCVKACPLYGRCHCGCMAPTNLCKHSDRSKYMVKGQPCVYVSGHAGAMARNPNGRIIPGCHPGRTHKARGLCKNCYDAWFKKNSNHVRKYRSKVTPERLKWETLRYKRCLELLWEHGYGSIATVIEQLDKELPAKEEVA